MASSVKSNFKVRLISVSSIANGVGQDPDQVIFEVTPLFTESGSVEYAAITPVHMPGSIQVYKNTKSRTFTIGAHFISRTVDEATQNMVNLQTLRAWKMPYFGSTSTLDSNATGARAAAVNNQSNANVATSQSVDQVLSPEQRARNAQARVSAGGVELLGAPPDVLYLYAYSTSANDNAGNSRPSGGVNINRVPVVLTDLSVAYPEDVDYLPTYSDSDSQTIDNNSEPFPIKMDVSITLLETHSPREYEQFDLMKYKQGTLSNF